MEVSARGHENALNALENAAAGQSNSQRQGRVLLDVASGRVAQAQAAAARGDEASAQRAGEGYTRALSGSMSAFSNAGLQGTDFESVLNRVANATEKHQATLQDVMGRVPEQAQGAIHKAMAASQRGYENATAPPICNARASSAWLVSNRADTVAVIRAVAVLPERAVSGAQAVAVSAADLRQERPDDAN